ncbi:hypothetical protein C8J57DRAFT_1476243 [Mycena rebaudengoi]|nr:hypothetical protein C8J57DRAFT_1476243 [Mycena rebaudengoi]
MVIHHILSQDPHQVARPAREQDARRSYKSNSNSHCQGQETRARLISLERVLRIHIGVKRAEKSMKRAKVRARNIGENANEMKPNEYIASSVTKARENLRENKIKSTRMARAEVRTRASRDACMVNQDAEFPSTGKSRDRSRQTRHLVAQQLAKMMPAVACAMSAGASTYRAHPHKHRKQCGETGARRTEKSHLREHSNSAAKVRYSQNTRSRTDMTDSTCAPPPRKITYLRAPRETAPHRVTTPVHHHGKTPAEVGQHGIAFAEMGWNDLTSPPALSRTAPIPTTPTTIVAWTLTNASHA